MKTSKMIARIWKQTGILIGQILMVSPIVIVLAVAIGVLG